MRRGTDMAGVALNSEFIPNRGWPRFAAAFAALLSLFLLQACSLPVRLNAVPKDIEASAEIPGMPGVRYWQVGDLERLTDEAIKSYQEQAEAWKAAGNKGPLPPANFLAISGGGENGAYGAGLLNGWTEAGTRPEFGLVTGVSTGALTAPFAFLGSAYDPQLKEVYTTITAKDVLEARGIFAAIWNDAMADNTPLQGLVAKYVNEDMLAKIAVEHRKGRNLLVGTTNLDARRGVIWDIGKIAEYGTPEALELVRKILVASAAIPGAFPPTMIDVEANGTKYQEMHVDGGASAQVFVYPARLHLAEISEEAGIDRERHIYVLRNGRLDPDWADTERQTLTIAGRAVSSLIQNQGNGDLYRIYALAQRDKVDFNLAYIPPTFDVPLPEPFDQHYMVELYELGYEQAKAGYKWEKAPLGY
jgi:predicted acylesterase/phospholipase RssA